MSSSWPRHAWETRRRMTERSVDLRRRFRRRRPIHRGKRSFEKLIIFLTVPQPWSCCLELPPRAVVASSPTIEKITCSTRTQGRQNQQNPVPLSSYVQELLIKRDYQAQKMRVEQSKLYRLSSTQMSRSRKFLDRHACQIRSEQSPLLLASWQCTTKLGFGEVAEAASLVAQCDIQGEDVRDLVNLTVRKMELELH